MKDTKTKEWQHLIPDDWVSSSGSRWKDLDAEARCNEASHNRALQRMLPKWWRDQRAHSLRQERAQRRELSRSVRQFPPAAFLEAKNKEEFVKNRKERAERHRRWKEIIAAEKKARKD